MADDFVISRKGLRLILLAQLISFSGACTSPQSKSTMEAGQVPENLYQCADGTYKRSCPRPNGSNEISSDAKSISDIPTLEKMCEKHDRVACLKLGMFVVVEISKQIERGEKPNYQSTPLGNLVQYCRSGAKLKNLDACAGVALFLGIAKRKADLSGYCKIGSPHACFHLGVIQFESESSSEKNKSLSNFSKACVAGVFDGCHYAGLFHSEQENFGDALQFLLKSCTAVKDSKNVALENWSATESCAETGKIYLKIGNHSRAREFLEPSCNYGDGKGQSCYFLVRLAGKTRDITLLERSMQWSKQSLTRECEKGDNDSCRSLQTLADAMSSAGMGF